MSEATVVLHEGEAGNEIIRTPVWGIAADRRAAAAAVAIAGALTGAYVLVARQTSVGMPTWLEIIGTVTSLACVIITRRQNVLCMPLGIMSVFATGAFFFQIDLVGQGWLNFAYYLPVQIVGWRVWIRSGEAHTDKPVSWMTWRGRMLVVLTITFGTVVLASLFEVLHGPSDTLLWDSSIVAASIAAQWLLTIKRIESWWLWLLLVDVSAVVLYVVSGAHLFAALYVVYLVLASLGLRDWVLAWRAQRNGLTPIEARLR